LDPIVTLKRLVRFVGCNVKIFKASNDHISAAVRIMEPAVIFSICVAFMPAGIEHKTMLVDIQSVFSQAVWPARMTGV
jgi:hypothetical protein